MRFLWCLVLSLLAGAAGASPDLVAELRKAEARFGLPDMTLVALSATESTLSWYALNFDDVASFYPKTKAHALNIVRSISARPYSVKVQKPTGDEEVYFFASRTAAQRAVHKAGRTHGYVVLEHSNGSTVKKIDLLNTGMCAMQLNYRYQAHGQGRTAEDLLDRGFCIEHASKFVAGLIERHGFEKGVGCYYTCGNSSRAARDREDYFKRYNRHLKRLQKSSSVAQR